MSAETTRVRFLQALRWTGRGVTILGLVLVCLGVTLYGSLDPVMWQVGFVLAAVGCIGLAALLALWFSPRGRAGGDATLGFLCLLLGLLGLFMATDEGGVNSLLILIVGALLVLGGIALVVASAASKRSVERWRNTGSRG